MHLRAIRPFFRGACSRSSRDAQAGVEVDLGRRIESVARVFGTDFVDELRGDRENNRLYGGEGNDTCVTDTPDFTEGCEKEGRGG